MAFTGQLAIIELFILWCITIVSRNVELMCVLLSITYAITLNVYAIKLYILEENNMPKFICNLKKYRQLKELTQEQLAEKVGVRRETIMRLEAGKYNPSLKLAIDISKIVDTPIDELFILIVCIIKNVF